MDDHLNELPPGWYLDPERPRHHRYWDGQNWSAWLAEEARGETLDAAVPHAS